MSSADGDDDNPGTEAQPLRSLPAARDALRRMRRRRRQKDSSNTGLQTLQVVLRGEFYLEETLELTAADHNTQWVAAEGKNATISGGAILSALSWQPVVLDGGHSVFRASLPDGVEADFDTLFDQEGNRLIRARFPNGNLERDMRPSGWISSELDKGIEWQVDANVNWHPPAHKAPSRWMQIEPCGWNNSQYGAVPAAAGADVPTTTHWLMGVCNSRMYFGRADRFTPPVMEGPQRAICGAVWHCSTHCDDAICSGAPPEAMRFDGSQLRTERWANDSMPVLHGYDANRFSTFHWEVDNFANKTLTFGRGGNQAGQGVYDMAEIFVENVSSTPATNL
eukprot:SAG11_NODE_926_length_6520_cov_6.586357_2_plen_337_part_00